MDVLVSIDDTPQRFDFIVFVRLTSGPGCFAESSGLTPPSSPTVTDLGGFSSSPASYSDKHLGLWSFLGFTLRWIWPLGFLHAPQYNPRGPFIATRSWARFSILPMDLDVRHDAAIHRRDPVSGEAKRIPLVRPIRVKLHRNSTRWRWSLTICGIRYPPQPAADVDRPISISPTWSGTEAGVKP
jgi:hypothetical protein